MDGLTVPSQGRGQHLLSHSPSGFPVFYMNGGERFFFLSIRNRKFFLPIREKSVQGNQLEVFIVLG